MLYTCAQCQRPVQLVDGVVPNPRPCGHNEAVVTAHLSAVVTGRGGMTQQKAPSGVR